MIDPHPGARQMPMQPSSSRPQHQHPQQRQQQMQQQQHQRQLQQQQQRRQPISQQQQQKRRGPGPNVIRCNLCRKPVVATVYVLSCNCLLCEGKHRTIESNRLSYEGT
jgi:hypothetical protein